MRIDIWSDIVCPWCYIGKRRLEQALEELPDGAAHQVVWRSYELNPNAPRASTETTRDMLARKYGVAPEKAVAMQAHVTAIAEGCGLDYHLDQTRPESSFDAHRLVHLAKASGLQGEMKERLLRAYFTEGLSINDKATLIRLAEEVGLGGTSAAETLDGDAFADAVRADEEEALRIGIRGVPFFVFNGSLALSGAQPVETFREALMEAASGMPRGDGT